MQKNKNKRSSKLIFMVFVIAGLLLLAFKLFEPIFVYNSGWTKLEINDSPPIETEFLGEQWRSQAERANNVVKTLYQKIDSPALSIAVSVDGKTAWRAATGYADLENRSPISLQHAFRIGSTSKAITSVTVGTLVDQGKLEFNDKLRDLEPSLSENLKSITLEQAMSHRAGIRNYGLCLCFPMWEHLNTRHFESVRKSINIIEESTLLAQPGESHRYTSLGFNLAGLAIAKSTGTSFSSAVQEQVLTPLGMQHTYVEDGSHSEALLAKPYEIDNKQYKPTFPVDQSIRLPSGGFLSTPSDMLKLGNSMLNEELLTKQVRSKLLTIPEKGRNNGGQIYALGWRVSDWKISSQTKIKSYHHNGVSVGGISVFIVFPEQRMVFSAMINKNGRNTNDLQEAVDKLVPIFLGV